jgi:fatty acid desaturase
MTLRFLALGFCKIALILAFAFVFRGTSLLERDGNGLRSTFDLAGLSCWTTLQLAMFELMHDATHGLSLSGRWFGHGNLGV